MILSSRKQKKISYYKKTFSQKKKITLQKQTIVLFCNNIIHEIRIANTLQQFGTYKGSDFFYNRMLRNNYNNEG